MAKLIENNFTKELSVLLSKHKKTISADKYGIYFPDQELETRVFIQIAESGTDNPREPAFFVNAKFD